MSISCLTLKLKVGVFKLTDSDQWRRVGRMWLASGRIWLLGRATHFHWVRSVEPANETAVNSRPPVAKCSEGVALKRNSFVGFGAIQTKCKFYANQMNGNFKKFKSTHSRQKFSKLQLAHFPLFGWTKFAACVHSAGFNCGTPPIRRGEALRGIRWKSHQRERPQHAFRSLNLIRLQPNAVKPVE